MNIKIKTFIHLYLFLLLIIWGANYVLMYGDSYFNLSKVFAALIDVLPGYLFLGFMCVLFFYVRSLRTKNRD
jgi:ABC-type microcin C transport system permease subunit YejB